MHNPFLVGWLSWLALAQPGTDDGPAQTQGAEVFFGLRTFTPMIYDGIERYSCRHALCRQLRELDTSYLVGKTSDERYVYLRRRIDPARPNNVGTLQEVTNGRLTQWRVSPAPTNPPRIRDYEFANAQQILASDVYVGLWHTANRGSPRTLVVLFDGGNIEGEGLPARCGPYQVIASVEESIDLLETRHRLLLGDAINLASYDEGSQAVWLARMLLPQEGLPCEARR